MLCIDFVTDCSRLPVDIYFNRCVPARFVPLLLQGFPYFPTTGHEAVMATDESVGSGFGVGVFPC